MHKYFVSLSVKAPGKSGYLDSTIDIDGPIDCAEDISGIRKAIAELEGLPVGGLVILNFILLSITEP